MYVLKYLVTFYILFFVISCNKKQENKEGIEKKPLLSVVNKYSSIKKVNSSFVKDIEAWEELSAVNSFLERFNNVSPKEVLSNAIELQGLLASLKDSVAPPLFDNPSFKARVNIAYNESLRLSDMNAIPSIKAEEVNFQTEKVLEAFSAVNSKVNSILSKKRFEEGINIDINFIGLDSTKIDSISKKSIKQDVFKRNVNNVKLDYREKQRP